jgi:hypothetical protein
LFQSADDRRVSIFFLVLEPQAWSAGEPHPSSW